MFVANGWLNIEDDDNTIYGVKDKSTLSEIFLNKELNNHSIL